MSPRPRKASDADVFAATLRVMARRGPADLTLADIAGEAGLTASALVQRFGSKRALLLALAEQFADGTAALFAGLRERHRSPLATLYAYGDCMARMGESADALAHHLSWLQQDLADPDFRHYTLRQARATRRALHQLVEDAKTAGELVRTVQAAALARAIEVTIGGSLMAWAVHQEGPVTDWIRQDLDALLRPLAGTVPRRGARVRQSRAARQRVVSRG